MTTQDFKVGDILMGMWHCTMHYPLYFQVIGTTPQKVRVQEIKKHMTRSTDGGYFQQGYEEPVVPYQPERGESPKLGTIDGEWLRIPIGCGSHVYAEKWDGQPVWADHMD